MTKIELNDKQLHLLLRLVYLGEWMSQAYGDSPIAGEIDELEQKLFKIAYSQGSEDVDHDKKMDAYCPCETFENECQEIVQQYDTHTFWEELIMQLATREFEQSQGEHDKTIPYEEKLNEFIQKYETEFNKNGLDNVSVKFSSKREK